MKKIIGVLILLPLLFAPAFAGDVLSVDEIIRKLDPIGHTSSEIREYRRAIKGKQAEGTGTVVNVLPGKFGRHRVTVLTKASKPAKGYNVVLYVKMDEPPPLKKGQKISVMGEVGRASTFRGLSIDIMGTYQ